jgi:uncharacterized membrane protein YhaH (DUF805 family)
MSSQPPSFPPAPPPPPLPPPGAAYPGYPQPSGDVPLWAPFYGASIGVAFVRFWKKYVDFTGRASRSEYWWWFLIWILVEAVLVIIGLATGSLGSAMYRSGFRPGASFWFVWLLLAVWALATFIPHLAIVWRRLHDSNLAGPFYFLAYIPAVGNIILLVLMLLPSNPEGARFDRPRT